MLHIIPDSKYYTFEQVAIGSIFKTIQSKYYLKIEPDNDPESNVNAICLESFKTRYFTNEFNNIVEIYPNAAILLQGSECLELI